MYCALTERTTAHHKTIISLPYPPLCSLVLRYFGEAVLRPSPAASGGNCPWASAHRGKWGQLTPLEKMDEKLKSENMQKSSLLNGGGVGERRYADHIFIQIYFRMHHFVVKFSNFSLPQAARGGIDPLTKILRTLLQLPPFPLLSYAAGRSSSASLNPYSLEPISG